MNRDPDVSLPLVARVQQRANEQSQSARDLFDLIRENNALYLRVQEQNAQIARLEARLAPLIGKEVAP